MWHYCLYGPFLITLITSSLLLTGTF